MSWDNPIAVIIVILSIALTFFISYWSRKWTKTTTDFYVAGGKIPWKLNGAAMFGDYCSAASFLGVAGAISLSGIDSWWIAIGFFGAWIVVLLVLAGPLKSAGKFTVGDILASRFGGRKLKLLAMTATVVIGTLYLVPQIVGAGHLFKLLLGWDYLTTVFLTGGFMGLMVIIGGMRGTTYNQAFQGILLLGAMLFLLIVSAILYFGWNPLNIISQAKETVSTEVAVKVAKDVLATAPKETVADAFAMAEIVKTTSPDSPRAMTPGVGVPDLWSQISLVLGLLLGTAGLPHILIRFYTVKDAKSAQKSAEMTIAGLAVFYIAVLFVGLAAMMVLYPTLMDLLATGQRGKATNMAVPLLGMKLGGEVALGIIAAGAMAAMLSTAVGLLISMTTSLSHDVYAGIIRPKSSDRERVVFAKMGAAVFTLIAILASIWLKDQNVAVLVGMCFGIAASTFAPVLIYALWWKGLTKQGAIAGLALGLVVSLIFTFARFLNVPEVFGIRVLGNPALYSVPVAFLTTFLVSYFTKEKGDVEKFMAMAHREQ